MTECIPLVAHRLRRRPNAAPALVLSLGLGLGAAQAQVQDITWPATGSVSLPLAIAPARFAELCGRLERGDAVQWRFTSNASTEFNLHFHAGTSVSYPEHRKGVRAASGVLRPAAGQTYCWMWTNRSTAPARVEVSLQRSTAAP